MVLRNLTGSEVAVPAKGTGFNRRTADRSGVHTVEMVALFAAL